MYSNFNNVLFDNLLNGYNREIMESKALISTYLVTPDIKNVKHKTKRVNELLNRMINAEYKIKKFKEIKNHITK